MAFEGPAGLKTPAVDKVVDGDEADVVDMPKEKPVNGDAEEEVVAGWAIEGAGLTVLGENEKLPKAGLGFEVAEAAGLGVNPVNCCSEWRNSFHFIYLTLHEKH